MSLFTFEADENRNWKCQNHQHNRSDCCQHFNEAPPLPLSYNQRDFGKSIFGSLLSISIKNKLTFTQFHVSHVFACVSAETDAINLRNSTQQSQLSESFVIQSAMMLSTEKLIETRFSAETLIVIWKSFGFDCNYFGFSY